jgi:hypothetical protein
MTKPDALTCVRTSKRPGSSSAANAVSQRVGYLAAQFYDNAEPGGDQAAGPLPAAVVGFQAAGRPFLQIAGCSHPSLQQAPPAEPLGVVTYVLQTGLLRSVVGGYRTKLVA